MTEHFFDHDRLDVYRLSIEYVAAAFASSRSLEGLHRLNSVANAPAENVWLISFFPEYSVIAPDVVEGQRIRRRHLPVWRTAE